VYAALSYCVCGLKHGSFVRACVIMYTCAPNGQDWAAVSHRHERLFRRPSSLSIFFLKKIFSKKDYSAATASSRSKRAHEASALKRALEASALQASALQAYENLVACKRASFRALSSAKLACQTLT
jgi:hypothetical protein